MSPEPSDSYVPFLETDSPERVAEIQRLLVARAIPYRSGLLAGSPPRVLFSVPAPELDEARRAVADDGRDDDDAPLRPEPPAPLPWRPLGAVTAVILLHFALVALVSLPDVVAREVWRTWGLVKGGTLDQPWRLVTSLFLHADVSHAMWNGLSMIVFAVPLVGRLGYRRAALVYLAAGVGGGLTAMGLAEAGTGVIGSSGAVAGLFGAWCVLAFERTRAAAFLWRARVRVLGVALLVLPSFLSPMTSTGRPVSVSSHVGGLLTGMAVGAVLSRVLERDEPPPVDELVAP